MSFGNKLLLFFAAFFVSQAVASDFVPLPSDFKASDSMLYWDYPARLVYKDDVNSSKRTIVFSLDKDDTVNIEVVAYAHSSKKNKWEGCSPFRLNIVTIKKDFMSLPDVRNSIIDSAVSYADALCPKSKTIVLSVSPLIKLDDVDANYFFKTEIKKDKKGKWQIYPAKESNIKDSSTLLKTEGRSKWRKVADDEYAKYKDASLAKKLALTHNRPELDNALIILQGSVALGENLPITTIIHIKQTENNKAWVDEPLPMLIQDKEKANKPGWWLISGNIRALGEHEKIKLGLSPSEPAGQLNVFKATSCEDKTCSSAANLISFIKERYGLYDWEPNKE